MFGIMLYDILFFGIPAIVLVLFGICLYRYRSAKNQNEEEPGSVSVGELKKRKILLIITAAVTGVFALVAVGFVALLFMAVAFM